MPSGKVPFKDSKPEYWKNVQRVCAETAAQGLTVTEAARRLGVDHDVLRGWVRKSLIDAYPYRGDRGTIKNRPETTATRKAHTEQEDWWPKAVDRFEELASGGFSRSKAALQVAKEFPAHAETLRQACLRGSVPAYPSPDHERAVAWKNGEARYIGKICPKHGTRERYSTDGYCVECMAEYGKIHGRRVRAGLPGPPALS